MKIALLVSFLFFLGPLKAQMYGNQDSLQIKMQLKANELVSKKAEYHRLTGGTKEGYRIKIHFGIDRETAEAMRIKFSTRFTDCPADMEYQQPNFVVLVGYYKTKLEAFEALKKVQTEFPNAFIVNGKIKDLP